MSRAIRLSRIHAINWYGYSDTLDVAGNLLIAGVTGSGKSVLMDLIQLVLVGTEKALFNRSATGATSDRTLRSYVLCDTKREENGQPQYVRDRGAIAFVALEFTWPRGDRAETWGMRLEFRNASETHGRITPFWCDGRLDKTDFLDAERRPLDIPSFRRCVEKDRDGRLFETQEQYLRDMANESHLNFNRNVLSTLLPTSMSFTNLKSFDEFCRRFILPGEGLNVGDVVASYKNFQAYERDLRELTDQLSRLNQIRDHFESHAGAARDRRLARHLAARLNWEYASRRSSAVGAELQALKLSFASEEQRINALDGRIAARRSEVKQAQAAIFQMPGGADYLALRTRLDELQREAQRLRDIGTNVESAWRARVRHARGWLDDARSLPLPLPWQLEEVVHAIQHLDNADRPGLEVALRELNQVVQTSCQSLQLALRPHRERLAEIRRCLSGLKEEITLLERGIPPGPRRLLNLINAMLPPNGREPAARQLRELCEVTDERWRPAIETALRQKFAAIVPEEHYESAARLLHGLREPTPNESLVNPIAALQSNREPTPGSLAEKLTSDHPIARALLNDLLGDWICVERREDIDKHDSTILPDGFSKQGAFIERPIADPLPFVGRKGLEQQLALKRSEVAALEAEDRRLTPQLQAADALLSSVSARFPEHTSMAVDLARVAILPEREAEIERAAAQLRSIDRASFEEKERELFQMEEELVGWETELRGLVGSQTRGAIERLEGAVAEATALLERAEMRRQKADSESGDLSPHAARIEAWRAEVLTEARDLDQASERFDRLESDARETTARSWMALTAARRELGMAYRKFDDMSPEDASNGPWEVLREQIQGANIPDYQAKSQAARAQWEGLFRAQILSKLDRALRDLKNTIALLNGNLRSPIGHDRYEIEAKASPDFKVYRALIDLNAQCQQDELFFASVDGELRAALERFLSVLVDQPDSEEASRLLDYRHYFDYDLLVWDTRDAQARAVSVDRQSGKFSGGENQSPYFVAILASYLRAYNRHETRWGEPSLAVVPIDEAFSKLSPERIEDCVRALTQLDLQGLLSMSAGNIPFAFSQCDQVIIVSKHEERRGGKTWIRNVPVSLLRASAEGQEWMRLHA